MKKVFSIAAVAIAMLFAGTTQAQKNNLTVNIGYAPQTFNTVTTILNTDTKTSMDMTGFFAGVGYTSAVTPNLGLTVGLQARYNYGNEENSLLKFNHTQFLVDVPVMLSFGIQMGNDIRLGIFAGPAFNFAVQGKTEIVGKISGNDDDEDWYEDGDDRQRFDISGAAGLSLQFRTVRLYGGYRMGFLDLNKNNNIKTTTQGLFVGLGYCL